MKNVLKKLMLVSCISALLVTPISIFANEVSQQETIEVAVVAQNGVTPRYIDENKVTIDNGDIYYFVNKANNQPFLFRAGTELEVTIRVSGPSAFTLGIADENNNIVANYSSSTNSSGVKFIAPFPIHETGRYKFFVMNFSPDPLDVYSFKVNIA